MNRYIRFDVEQFLRDSLSWKDQLKEYDEELRSITEIGGGGGEVHSGGGVSNPTQNTALKVAEITSKMERIYEYQEAFAFAWERISTYDQDMIKGFFFAPGYVYNFVKAWCEERASNQRYCYRDRNKALDNFRVQIERWIKKNDDV